MSWGGYSRFRRYTPRMLRTLDIEASPAAEPLLDAVDVLRSDGTARPTGFLRPNSRWSRLLRTQSDHRLWETAVLFHLRDAFRVGGIWLVRSRRYGDIRRRCCRRPPAMMATAACRSPASPHDWLAERRFALDEGLRRLAAAARADPTAGESIEDSVLRVERPEAAVTRPTPSSASWSRTAGRSWRTSRPTRTAPAVSPSSTAPCAPRRG